DPRETLDYGYQRQMEMLQKVKRGLLDVATSRKRLELQGEQLQAKAAKLHDQAQRAMVAGREDLAREALTRRAAIEPELESLKVQHGQLQAAEAKLTGASKRLSAPGDRLEAELGHAIAASQIDAELARMKAELPTAGESPKEIES